MTRLLVSVRSVEEAQIALAAGVDLIDLKEPSRGSLGRVDDAVARDVAQLVAVLSTQYSVRSTQYSELRTPHSVPDTLHSVPGTPHAAFGTPHSVLRTPYSVPDTPHSALGTAYSVPDTPNAVRVPLSMALGELVDLSGDEPKSSVTNPPTLPAGIDYFKIGLAGCAGRRDWPERLRQFTNILPPAAGLVAVVYADAELCHAPPAAAVVETAATLGAKAVLVDTAVKNGRGLFDWWSEAKLTNFAADVRQRGMFCVAGGSLTTATIPAAVRCRVDYIAVRGAACPGPRSGTIHAAQVQAVRKAIAAVCDSDELTTIPGSFS